MASRLIGHPWAGHMTWRDLLFAHWPVPAGALRDHIPSRLEIDQFAGTAWLTLAPFAMTGIHLRGMPSLPGLSRTLELNLRTYVREGKVSGVWFFSLDAASWPAVIGARAIYHLNYFHARMSLRHEGERIMYESCRCHHGAPPAEFRASYKAVGSPFISIPGSLECWLTERYALFAGDRHGRLYHAKIQHARWPLQTAAAEFEHNSMTAQIGLDLPTREPLLHFAKSLDVQVWLPELLIS